MRSFVTLSTVCTGLLAASLCQADIVEIKDGSRLNGEIVKIHDGKLSLETSFAGVLEIALADVTSFTSEGAETVRLADGTTAVGPVRSAGAGQIAIATNGGSINASTADVVASWAPGEIDPDVAAREAELTGMIRKWSYQAAVGLSTRSGNTEKSDYNASLKAALEGPNDRLVFYTSWQYAEAEGYRTNDEGVLEEGTFRTNDELIGGVSYTNFFSDKMGWYVREELERDTFENIDFRSTSALGLTLRPINQDTVKLELAAGVALRYEGYSDGGSESFPGLDISLKHYWKFAAWGEMNNSITYNPAFEDFGNYRIDHLSAVDVPLGSSDFWKLRASLANQYNSEAPVEQLDTTWALSLLLNWK